MNNNNKQQQHHHHQQRQVKQQHLKQEDSSLRMIAPVRVARNVAEKQRRDKLNAFIADLANSVPLVASATKRLDKTSILRLAAAFLRLHDSPLNTIGYNLTSNDIVEGSDNPSSSLKPKLFPGHIKALQDGLEGFIIVVNSDLKFIYVAQTCEKFLGHQNIDMMGFHLTAFVHPGDVDAVKHVLEEARRDLLRSGKKESERIQLRCRMKERSQPRTEVVTYQMVQIVGSFQFPNFKDPSSICSSTSQPHVHNTVSLINNNLDVKNNNLSSSPSSSMMDMTFSDSLDSIADQEGRENSSFILPPSPAATSLHRSDSMSSSCTSFSATSSMYSNSRTFSGKRKLEESSCPSPGSEVSNNFTSATSVKSMSLSPSPELTSSSDLRKLQPVSPTYVAKNLLFKGFVQVIPSSPMAELSLIDANQEEYVTRLSLDGVLLYADHRISTVAGYMPDEVVGRSAYAYILVPDHVISLFAHKLMLSNSNGTGIIVHRLRKRTGEYVYLQSAGCLQYDRSTGQVDHFICVSRLLHEEEGDKERQKFVKRFTPHISEDSPSTLYESLQLVIGPKNSRAVKYQSFVSNVFSPSHESRDSESLAIESSHVNKPRNNRIQEITEIIHPGYKGSIVVRGGDSPVHSSSPEAAVVSPTMTQNPPQLFIQSIQPPMPTFVAQPTPQNILQPTVVQNINNGNLSDNSIVFSSIPGRQEVSGTRQLPTGQLIKADPTIYVKLPSDASGILADGSFSETSESIMVGSLATRGMAMSAQQQQQNMKQNKPQQQTLMSQPQVIVDQNGIVLGQLSPSTTTAFSSQQQAFIDQLNSQGTPPSVYPDQNLPQDIKTLLNPNQIILDRLRRHANNARYVMSNTSSASRSADTSVLTMSRVLHSNGPDPMTGAIVFGVNQVDSSSIPSAPSSNQLHCTINTSSTQPQLIHSSQRQPSLMLTSMDPHSQLSSHETHPQLTSVNLIQAASPNGPHDLPQHQFQPHHFYHTLENQEKQAGQTIHHSVPQSLPHSFPLEISTASPMLLSSSMLGVGQQMPLLVTTSCAQQIQQQPSHHTLGALGVITSNSFASNVMTPGSSPSGLILTSMPTPPLTSESKEGITFSEDSTGNISLYQQRQQHDSSLKQTLLSPSHQQHLSHQNLHEMTSFHYECPEEFFARNDNKLPLSSHHLDWTSEEHDGQEGSNKKMKVSTTDHHHRNQEESSDNNSSNQEIT